MDRQVSIALDDATDSTMVYPTISVESRIGSRPKTTAMSKLEPIVSACDKK